MGAFLSYPSIDKIVFVSQADNSHVRNYSCSAPGVCNSFPLTKNYFYNRAVKFHDDTYLELGKYYGLRITFNPNTPNYTVRTLLSMLDEYHISQIHIAIDYFENILKYFWFDKTGKRRVYYKRDEVTRKVNTIYFGKRKSSLTYSVYNKALEQGIDSVWWRVEARLRYPSFKNILPLNLFEPIHAGGFELFNKHLMRLRNFPEYFKQLSSYRRSQARKLSILSSDGLVPQPSDVYKQRRAMLIGEIYKLGIIIPATINNSTTHDYFDSDNELVLQEYFD